MSSNHDDDDEDDDDESGERCGSTSEVDGRSVQGDRIDSSVVRMTLELYYHRRGAL